MRGWLRHSYTSRQTPFLLAGTPTALAPNGRQTLTPTSSSCSTPYLSQAATHPPGFSYPFSLATACQAPSAQPEKLLGGPNIGAHGHHVPQSQQLALLESWTWAPECWAFSPSDCVQHTARGQGRASVQPHCCPQATLDGACPARNRVTLR